MQYRYFERPSTGERTPALFAGERLQAETAASQAADIAAALGWGDDVRAVTMDADPGPGTVQLPTPEPTPEQPDPFALIADKLDDLSSEIRKAGRGVEADKMHEVAEVARAASGRH
jgi:hypothetical protein